jgi:hypothetical protein
VLCCFASFACHDCIRAPCINLHWLLLLLFPQAGGDQYGYDEDEDAGGAAADDDELYRRRPIDQEEEVSWGFYNVVTMLLECCQVLGYPLVLWAVQAAADQS